MRKKAQCSDMQNMKAVKYFVLMKKREGGESWDSGSEELRPFSIIWHFLKPMDSLIHDISKTNCKALPGKPCIMYVYNRIL